MPEQYGFYHEPEKCIKCFACEIACKQWHGIAAGTVKLRRVVEVAEGKFPGVTRTFHSIACQHCAKPPCVDSCPTDAIGKREEDGIITVDSGKCIGCFACLEACPFGIPQFDAKGIARLCNMCLDRLAQGKRPICSDACPTGALHWGTLKQLSDFKLHHAVTKMSKAE